MDIVLLLMVVITVLLGIFLYRLLTGKISVISFIHKLFAGPKSKKNLTASNNSLLNNYYAKPEDNFNFHHDEPSTNYAPTYTYQSTPHRSIPQPTRTFTPPAYSHDNYELKYDYKDVFLALSNNYDCSGVTINDPCILAGEPSNAHDPKAVAVYCRDKKIGYLKKGRLQDMYYDFIDSDEKVTATISKIEDSNVFIRLCFYKEIDVIEELKKNHETKCYKLTGNRNSEMQDSMFLFSEGEEIYYHWDFDKEKYGTDIGFFPKSANQYLENDVPAYIYEIEEDDDGKYSVTVIIQID